MSAGDGVSLNGDGVVDMDPVDTAKEMTVVDAEGTHLETTWNPIKASLPGPGTFGHGLLGLMFNNRTAGPDASIRTAADAIPQFYHNISAAGTQLVKAYVAHDAEAAGYILVQLS